jgi:hypothetical protein
MGLMGTSSSSLGCDGFIRLFGLDILEFLGSKERCVSLVVYSADMC